MAKPLTAENAHQAECHHHQAGATPSIARRICRKASSPISADVPKPPHVGITHGRRLMRNRRRKSIKIIHPRSANVEAASASSRRAILIKEASSSIASAAARRTCA